MQLFTVWQLKRRNVLFDYGILKSHSFTLPIIAIGNLSTGGTGKSPMVEYLVRLLQDRYQVATLSRGYGRKTKGYLLATKNTLPTEMGDEPMQLHKKFPKVTVAVGEKIALAIPQILRDKPATDLIILDDALQHRQVTAGLTILLTSFQSPFYPRFIPACRRHSGTNAYLTGVQTL